MASINALALRRAGRDDLGAVVGLRLAFELIQRDSGSLDLESRGAELAALLGPDLESGRLRAWLAFDGGRAVGQAALRLPRPGPGSGRAEGEILNVYVEPEYRRGGLGAALVDLAIAEARGLGLKRLRLQPTPDSRRLYERSGFRDGGRDMLLDLCRPGGEEEGRCV